ncbi:YolD-like family protein [Sporosarcina psychrophila]|uniref:YolD-like family protein n=1 Tax=Sporosarcina psychrophila TaxID=1476 RepID=A0ABV2KEM2_SPOPS
MRNHDIKDRGIMKWQGLMLTDHVKLIRKQGEEINYIQQTLLDDWELQQIQEELEIAYKRQCAAQVTVWRKGEHITYIGKISELNYRLSFLSVEGPFGHDRIPVADIIKVHCVD